MLRLSETEERAAREFRKMCTNGAEADRSFGGTGRVVRSPTLFEDMVKLSHDPLGGQLEDSWKRQWVTLGGADTWRVLV
jgi:hypothetical protein